MRVQRGGSCLGDSTYYHLDAVDEIGNLSGRLRQLVPERMLTMLRGFPESVESLAREATIPSLAAWLRSAARSRGSIAVYDPVEGFPPKAFFEFDFGPRMTAGGSFPWTVLVDLERGRPEDCPPSLGEVYETIGGIVEEYGASGTLISPREVAPLASLQDYELEYLLGPEPDREPVDLSAWWPWFERDGDYLCYHADGTSRWLGDEWGALGFELSTHRCVEDLFTVLLRNTSFNGESQQRLHRGEQKP